MAASQGILVTGSHRSGSTWVGRLLAAADELHYVHEPFNIVARIRWTPHRPPHQFYYVCTENEGRWDAELASAMALRVPVLPQLTSSVTGGRLKRLARLTVSSAQARRRGKQPLVKDPIALFSTEWLADRFGLTPLILVRNPVSFVGSLKERNWSFDFRHWVDQPLLMDHLLHQHRDQILAQARQPGTVVEQGIVQWNAMYSVVEQFRRDHPDWLVVRYEDLAASPGDQIPALYQRLGLSFGERQESLVRELSQSGTGGGSAAMDLRRDSRAAMETWRQRLDDDEVAAVERGTATLARAFYPES